MLNGGQSHNTGKPCSVKRIRKHSNSHVNYMDKNNIHVLILQEVF